MTSEQVLCTPFAGQNLFFSAKTTISTSERRAEHPFAGRNTQQTSNTYEGVNVHKMDPYKVTCNNLDVYFFI